jgi:hypothetical protein
MLTSDRNHNKGEIKSLQQTNGDLEKRLRAWQKAFEVMRKNNDVIRQLAFEDREKWNHIESTNNETIERMTEQIFQLRSGIEETKIIENDLLEGYKTLIAAIQECTGMLAYYQQSSEGWEANKTAVRANLHFDSPLLSQLSLHEYQLPAKILRLVMTEVEKHLYPGLTQWKDLHSVEPAPFGAALNEFEKDVAHLINSSQAGGETPSAASKGKRWLAGNQKSKVLPKPSLHFNAQSGWLVTDH